jgi:hypothetical protein
MGRANATDIEKIVALNVSLGPKLAVRMTIPSFKPIVAMLVRKCGQNIIAANRPLSSGPKKRAANTPPAKPEPKIIPFVKRVERHGFKIALPRKSTAEREP